MPQLFDSPPALSQSWLSILEGEFEQSYFGELRNFLRAESQAGKTIYPASEDIFNAFSYATFDEVKVVILGQDPYHGPGQAHGLSFSVGADMVIPPSLKNIYKELVDDCGVPAPEHGNLQSWAEQGVLLLNTTLTVEQASAGSHQNQGWELFTDAVISSLSEHRENLVFFLWGAFAQQKAKLIDGDKHLLITAAHPSPLSAYRGFFGSKPFSQANSYLVDHGQLPIDWRLPNIQKRLF